MCKLTKYMTGTVALIFLLTLSEAVFSQEHSESFWVQAHDTYIKVLAPEQYSKGITVIISNKTLSRLLGKIVTASGKVVQFVSIDSEENMAVNIDVISKEAVFFVPLVPAFQEVELKFGKKTYEIPPKR